MGERSFTLELELATSKYRYARVFLDYLEAAKKLLVLQNSLSAVEPAREVVANGHREGCVYKDISIEAERVLNPLRNIGRLAEELDYAIGRFDVDLELAKTVESRCWEALVKAVNAVPKNESWDGGPWYRGNMSAQHDLLIADSYSLDRIDHYQRELSDTLFEYTPSPDSLEVNFRLSFGKMLDSVVPPELK